MVYNTHHLLYTVLMRSIKSLLNQLSPILDMSPGAIYERQRALVRLGALRAVPGKAIICADILSSFAMAVTYDVELEYSQVRSPVRS